MLALSVVTPSGSNIAAGRKTIEVRSWKPEQLPLRNLLIIENNRFLNHELLFDPHGKAVALVDVEEIHEWQPNQVEAACSSGWQPGYWAWKLTNVRSVTAKVDVPAKLGIYEVDLDEALLSGATT
ncbi:ASCH domain-containing protein [Pseudomonas cavernicola]|uniref:ASCH domain-containing protein n=2 Tax=Pseudomonas cavernicola TaxID=2320866 RepID=A0A418XEP2_9PSED|nr:ASCH domain-containing protein [Pseudomonas cavernicola]